MVKKLVSKVELARMAGVSSAAITKAIKNHIGDAVEGRRIDVNHPSVVKYLSNDEDDPLSPATGIDPLYQDAVNHCRLNNRYTQSSIARGLKIGFSRAEKILKMMRIAGTNKPPASKPPPPPLKPPHLQNTSTKKKISLDKLNNPVDNGNHLHEIPEDIKAFAEMTLNELIQRFGTDIAFLDWLKATKSIEDINEKRLKNAVSRGELVSRELVKVSIIEPINAAHLKLLTDGAKTIARRVTAMHGAGRSLEDCEKFVIDQIGSFIKPMKAKVTRALKNA